MNHLFLEKLGNFEAACCALHCNGAVSLFWNWKFFIGVERGSILRAVRGVHHTSFVRPGAWHTPKHRTRKKITKSWRKHQNQISQHHNTKTPHPIRKSYCHRIKCFGIRLGDGASGPLALVRDLGGGGLEGGYWGGSGQEPGVASKESFWTDPSSASHALRTPEWIGEMGVAGRVQK